MQYHHSTLEYEINFTEYSCKLTEDCFSLIMKELLNWYWWLLALVGFKMHSQARAFLQPTRANIHQYSPKSFKYHYSTSIFLLKKKTPKDIIWNTRKNIIDKIWFNVHRWISVLLLFCVRPWIFFSLIPRPNPCRWRAAHYVLYLAHRITVIKQAFLACFTNCDTRHQF